MHRRRFAVAYVVLFVAVMCAATILACAALVGGETTVVSRGPAPITNKTYPNDVLLHFGPNAFATFDGEPYGVRDGYCKAYTNEVSWLVISCQGSVIQP